jgi:hypothetical protein
MGCGKPGADYRRNRWHEQCWDTYREGSNYRGAAERREGKHQRCANCGRVTGEIAWDRGKAERIKVQRDHIIALALNGRHDWTAPRCQFCHQDKTTDDNRRVKDWRAADPRANRANRSDRRKTMPSTPPRSAASRNRSGPPPQSRPIGTALRAIAGLAFIGIAVLWLTSGSIQEAIDRLEAIGRTALPWAIAAVASALVAAITAWAIARVRRARAEAIYRLKNALSQKLRVAPDVIQIKVKRWRHGVPVRGSAWYSETVDDEPESPVRVDVERMLEHKLGLRLAIDWDAANDTVHWWPIDDRKPLTAHDHDDDTDPGPEDAEQDAAEEAAARIDAVRERVEEKVRSLIKPKDPAAVVFEWGPADAIGPLSFRLGYPSAYNDESGDTRQDLVDGVNAKAPGRWRATWNTEENRVEFERRPPMPSNVLIPVATDGDSWRLPFGVDEHGDQVVWNMKMHPHALIAGGTGSGKTVTLRAFIQAAVARGFVVFCVDPKRIEMAGLRGWPGVRVVATGVTHMIALVTLLADVMDDRYEAIEDGKVTEDQLPPVLVVIDEAREFIDRANAFWRANKTGSGQEHPVIERWRSMARLGRSGRMHLLVGIQRPDAKVVGGEARDNYGFRAALGSMSPEGAKMMFGRTDVGRDIPEEAKGRATVGIGNEAIEVQGYNTPDPRKDTTPGAMELLGQLRALATEHASPALSEITAEMIDELAEEMQNGRGGERKPARRTGSGKPPAASRRPQIEDGWQPCTVFDLAVGETARIPVDGEMVEVTIVELVESADDDDLIEITYRDADGNEAVIALDTDEQVWGRTAD